MRKPEEIAAEKVKGKEGGSLGNIDAERGHPGKDDGGASLKPEEDGEKKVHERNRAPSPGSTPVSQADKLKRET